MKKLVIVCLEKDAMTRHVMDLQNYFEGCIQVEGYFYRRNDHFPEQIKGDLVCLASQELTSKLWNRIDPDTPIIYLERTLSRKQAAQLEEIPPCHAFFIDYHTDVAMQMISRLTEFGIRNIRMIPVGHESPREELLALQEKNVSLAITAGLGRCSPIEHRHVLDLGWALIDAKTLLEVSVILDLDSVYREEKLMRYMQKLITSERNIMFFLKTAIFSKNIYQSMMESMEEGVLISDYTGCVTTWNSSALELLKINSGGALTPAAVQSRLPKELTDILQSDALLWNEMVYVPQLRQNLILTRQAINVFGNPEGHMLTLKALAGVQRQNARIRRQMHRHLYQAKYTFDDILGSSDSIIRMKRTAMRIAAVDGTVLITGESGTGKELFAQSIHNASHRREMPFVPINCAALSPTLLESELFGYERGAFTGAKNEGHIGVFEMAHQGTVFLDEVGELPMNVQAKLLRVLEEHEVRRVGGTENIPIDVRVIAATNQDLPALIRDKLFRQDLYYRLNVLPLPLTPLRERPGDILALAEYFLDQVSSQPKEMTERLQQVLRSFPWEGNGRELNNCMQYMAYLSESVLDVDLLPAYILQRITPPASPAVKDGEAGGLAREILSIVKEEPVGREELTVLLRQRGYPVSEYRVRCELRDMKQKGLITYGRGHQGIIPTK